ncbi:DNA-binding protein [Filobacillus milosensis]|uniref:DNA-binding protein n=1 Tax=Filobacillus milosensis TaxID=94137 RepID=A0A4Y8IDQ0_9BACI|nr:helix-turn-helix domain-containing protein [Filobacillus milosensis]TFB14112.1 DNA-binding protein [Filobacillus milosensis]
MKYKKMEDLPMYLTATEISDLLQISKPTAYEMMKKDDFPLAKFGKIMRVNRDQFFKWLSNQERQI